MRVNHVNVPETCLRIPGAENGSSSQGAVGQSGPAAAGSSGGVSKNAKGQGPAEKEEQAGNQKRARRQWESWSAEDKNSFFEGLYEVRGGTRRLTLKRGLLRV